MNKKINLFSLINSISSQTGQDPELVEKFVLQLFKEIEKELVTSSHVKIEKLGIFRIIKSLPNDRILFLGHFENDKISPDESDEKYTIDQIEVLGQQNENEDRDDNPNNDNEELRSFYEESVIAHNDNNEETPETYLSSEDEQDSYDGDSQIEDFLYEYKNHEIEENKRKRFSKIRIAILLVLTLAGVSLLLMFLYPRDNKDDLSAPITIKPSYTLLENTDTINYLQIIELQSELDFVVLSQDFYGYGIFWPYIYKANEKEIPDPLQIKEGSIVKIPRMDKDLIDENNEESRAKVETLSNEIIKSRSNTTTRN